MGGGGTAGGAGPVGKKSARQAMPSASSGTSLTISSIEKRAAPRQVLMGLPCADTGGAAA